VAYFPMLRAGRYVAKAYFSARDNSISDYSAQQISEVGTTGIFEIAPGQVGTTSVDLVVKKFGVLFVQTYPTSDPANGATAALAFDIYNPDGGWFGQNQPPGTDSPHYPAFGFYPLPTRPGTYWLCVRGIGGWNWQTGQTLDAKGEYALYLTVDPDGLQSAPAPGTYANPPADSGGQGSKTHQRNASSQLIEFNKVYYCNMSDDRGEDYYRFVIP